MLEKISFGSFDCFWSFLVFVHTAQSSNLPQIKLKESKITNPQRQNPGRILKVPKILLMTIKLNESVLDKKDEKVVLLLICQKVSGYSKKPLKTENI